MWENPNTLFLFCKLVYLYLCFIFFVGTQREELTLNHESISKENEYIYRRIDTYSAACTSYVFFETLTCYEWASTQAHWWVCVRSIWGGPWGRAPQVHVNVSGGWDDDDFPYWLQVKVVYFAVMHNAQASNDSGPLNISEYISRRQNEKAASEVLICRI